MNRCWIIKQIIAWQSDSRRPLPRFAQAHLQQCPECQAHYEQEMRLIQDLIDTAPQHHVTDRPFLCSRILSAIAAQNTVAAPTFGWHSKTLAWAASIALVAIGLTLYFGHQRSAQPVHVAVSSPSTLTYPDHLPTINKAKLNDWTAAMEGSLKREMQLLISDATNAVNSLALAFLPDQMPY